MMLSCYKARRESLLALQEHSDTRLEEAEALVDRLILKTCFQTTTCISVVNAFAATDVKGNDTLSSSKWSGGTASLRSGK